MTKSQRRPNVTTIRATVRGGRLELERPIDLPDGTKLDIPIPETDDLASPEEIARGLAAMARIIPFATEEEQSEDPEAIEKWIADLRASPSLSETPQQEEDRVAWARKMKEFNIEAVRKQFERGE